MRGADSLTPNAPRPQEDRAGAVKEREGDVAGAVALYLSGGAPGRAAQVRPGDGRPGLIF